MAGECAQVLAHGLGAGHDLEPADDRDELLERHVVQLPREPGPLGFGGLRGSRLPDVAEDRVLDRLAEPPPGRGQDHHDGEEHRPDNDRGNAERVDQHQADDRERGDDPDVEQPRPHHADRLPAHDRDGRPIGEQGEGAPERKRRACALEPLVGLGVGEASVYPESEETQDCSHEADADGHGGRNAPAEVDRWDQRGANQDRRRYLRTTLEREWDTGGEERQGSGRDHPTPARREEEDAEDGENERDGGDGKRGCDTRVRPDPISGVLTSGAVAGDPGNPVRTTRFAVDFERFCHPCTKSSRFRPYLHCAGRNHYIESNT